MPRMAARGSVPRRKPKALSTDAALAGGPARSSREPAAFWGGGGAKGPAHQGCPGSVNRGSGPGRNRGNMPKPKDKPFAIPKPMVREAEMYPLLRRVSLYLRRWAGKKYRRLRTYKRFKRWWAGLLKREPGLFAHWRWVRAF